MTHTGRVRDVRNCAHSLIAVCYAMHTTAAGEALSCLHFPGQPSDWHDNSLDAFRCCYEYLVVVFVALKFRRFCDFRVFLCGPNSSR